LSKLEQIKLSDFFRQFKPTHVLGTTYTVSPVFFEANLWHEISKEKLRGCVILCDRKGFQRATQEAGALRAAARAYSLVHVPARAAFHPKVWIMLDEERLSLLCGSGNLTQSGFIENLELFETVTLNRNGPGSALAGDILAFVEGLRSYWTASDEGSVPAAHLLQEMHARIREFAGTLEPEKDGVRFLSSFGGAFPHQFSKLGPIKKVWVAAPYFGGSLSGVRSMQDALSPKETILCPASHGEAGIDLPPHEVGELPATRLSRLKLNEKRKTFAHYKLFGFELEDGGRYAFTGSVNATFNALSGTNVEAGILRRLNEKDFHDLFTEAPSSAESVQANLEYEADDRKWIGFWVTGGNRGMEIVVADACRSSLPVRSVHLEIKCSTGRFSATRDEAFVQSSRCAVAWKEFGGLDSHPLGIVLVRLNGVDPHGNPIHGTALVEDYVALTSTPGQRNAFQGALALLQGEGLPDSGELAAVFSLLAETLDVRQGKETEVSVAQTSSGAKSETAEKPERVPLWPPIAREVSVASAPAGSSFGQIAWFQRVLGQFLVHRDAEEPGLPGLPGLPGKNGSDKHDVPELSTTGDLDSEEDSERESDDNINALVKVCTARWKQAADALAGLEHRFGRLEIAEGQKDGVLPICIGIPLACLALKKNILGKVDPAKLEIPENSELAASFVAIVLSDRKQAEDYVRPKGARYHNEVFPPILEDLVEALDTKIDRDLGIVLLAFLAYNHATRRAPIPRHEWMEFRHLVERQGYDLRDWASAAIRTAHVYLINDFENVTLPHFRGSLDFLLGFDLKCVPGWAVLKETWAVAKRDLPKVSEETKTAFGEAWFTFENMLERVDDPASLFVRTSLHALFCANRECRGRGMKQPAFSRLRTICPVICPRCGTVQVPQLLSERFFSDGTHD